MAWLSPAYPVGGFAYSHGLEWAVDVGDVSDETSLGGWLGDLVARGAVRNDMILASHAHAAFADPAALAAVNALALALAPSRELLLETSQQGRSFLDATLAAWPCPALDRVGAALPDAVAYPVALGAASGAHGIGRRETLAAFGLAFVQAIVSAALRVAPIGQSAGTRLIAGLAPRIATLADTVQECDLDAIGSATWRIDLGSFRHETQYSRIFRS